MAKGNWNPSVIQPKARCRFCTRVVEQKDIVRVDGLYPAHVECAQLKGCSPLNYAADRPTDEECLGHVGRFYTMGAEIVVTKEQRQMREQVLGRQ